MLNNKNAVHSEKLFW